MCLKDSRNKRKTERSEVLMLITTVCLFSICITLTLVFYRWHTLSLIAILYTAIALSLTDYLASYFHKILYTAILLHSLHYYARKRPILGLLKEKVSRTLPKEKVSCVTWFIHLPVRVASLRCLRLSHNIYRSKADFGCR